MTTPITNELVREYISNNTTFVFREKMLSEWDKFLASKQAKDWEVVSFKAISDNIYRLKDGVYLNDSGKGFAHDFYKEGSNCTIIEVRRLPDNTIFSVNEVTQEGKITEFKIEANTIMWCKINGIWNNLKDLHKLPERKPVLVTEDGVEKFKGDNCFYLETDLSLHTWTKLPEPLECRGCDISGYKYFHTRQAAEEYVREHKPEISRAMIKGAFKEIKYTPPYIHEFLTALDKQLNP